MNICVFPVLSEVKFYILLSAIVILFNSCSKEDFEAQLPSYISIDEIDLVTAYSQQGSNSSKITDAWVFFNDDLVGVFELPVTFPILKEGAGTFKIYGGIRDFTKVPSVSLRYPLYDPYVEKVNLVKGETIKFTPTVNYSSQAVFPWLEDFEDASLSILYTNGSDTIINKTSSNSKEGSFSGKVFMAAGMSFFEATSFAITSIPRNGSPVFLEMDFKTNEKLAIGIYLDGQKVSFFTLNTTADWKKTYINLTDRINENNPASDVKVFIGLQAPFETSNPEVLIDNLKIVHL